MYATSIDIEDYQQDEEVDIYGLFVLDVNVHTVYCKPTYHTDPRVVALESFANHTFGSNRNLFTDIRDHNYTVRGVNGKAKGTEIGRLPCFGDAAITPNAGCNAISQHDAEHYRVEYFQREKYIVHVSDDIKLYFMYDPHHKTYVCIFTDEILQTLMKEDKRKRSISLYTATCSENEKRYSKTEVTAARNNKS